MQAFVCTPFGGQLAAGRAVSTLSRQGRFSVPSQRSPAVRSARRTVVNMAAASLYEVKMNDIDGNPVDFSSMEGKVVLAVNVASRCGYTRSGYTAMKNIADKYPDQVAVVAFPSNEFGAQESGSPEQIKDFVKSNFGDPKIVLMEKSSVKGPGANEVFKMASAKGLGEPGWNFDGRLIFGKDGKIAGRLNNNSGEKEIEGQIKDLL